jgi:hypothetical protein
MSQQIINVGSSPNDGAGDPIRAAFIKTNTNFTQLFALPNPTPPTTLVGKAGDVPGMYAYNSTYFYYCFGTYNGSSTIWAQVTQIGNISTTSINNGTSNVRIQSANANVTISVDGSPNVAIFSSTEVSLAGNIHAFAYYTYNNVSAAGNVRGGNIRTAGQVTATGNVYGDVIVGNYFYGDGSNISNISGVGGNYGNSNVANYLPTYSGNLTANDISITGNIQAFAYYTYNNVSAAGNVRGGNIRTAGQVTATGNVYGDVIVGNILSATGNVYTDGYFVGTFAGNIAGNLTVPGANTQVLFNTNGNADAVVGMTYDKGSNLFTVLGTISAQSNVVASNILSNNYFYSNGDPFVSSNYGNSNVADYLPTYGGNITSGNISVSNNIEAGGGATFGAPISVIGNITGNYFIGNGSQLSGIITQVSNISNGLSSVTIPASSGNIAVSVGVISNAAVFTPAGLSVLGDISANGLAIAGTTTFITLSVTGNSNFTGDATFGNIIALGSTIFTGNIEGNNIIANMVTGEFIGNGGALFNLDAANIVGTVLTAESSNTANSATTASTAANAIVVTGNAQPNITSVGTLSSLEVSGNISGNNIILTSGASIGANISISGTVTAANFIGDGSQITGVIVPSGNNIVNGLSTVRIPAASGNIALTVGAVANAAVFTPNGLTLVGAITTSGLTTPGEANVSTLTVTGNSNFTGDAIFGNIIALGSTTFTGNIEGNNIIANMVTGEFIGNGGALFNLDAANIVGAILNSEFANVANFATTATSAANAVVVTGNAQPNITSVGTLSSLEVSGNISGNNLILNSGAAIGSNISISGTVTAATFIGDGSQITGVIASQGNTIANGISSVSIPEDGGNVTITAGVVANAVVISPNGVEFAGDISAIGVNAGGEANVGAITVRGNSNFIGDALFANISASGNIEILGNVTAGNFNATLITGSFYGSGAGIQNISASNVIGHVANADYANAAGFATNATYAANAIAVTGNAQPNITSVGALNSLVVTGNITSNNITLLSGASVGSNISISGTVTAANFIGDGSQITGVVASQGNIIANGLSTVNIPVSSGNITISVGVISNIAVFTTNGLTVANNITVSTITSAGAISSAGNVSAANILVNGFISSSGNITANYIFGNASLLTGLPDLGYGNANVANYLPTYTGNLNSTNLVAPNIATTMISAVGSNITIVSSTNFNNDISVAGNITVNNNSSINGITTGMHNGLVDSFDIKLLSWDFGFISANTYTNPMQYLLNSVGSIDMGTFTAPASLYIDVGSFTN